MKYRKTFTLRLEEKMIEKLHYIAAINKRSLNNLIEVVLEKHLENFEKEHGEIIFVEEPEHWKSYRAKEENK